MQEKLETFFEILRLDVVGAAPALLGMHLVSPGIRVQIVETEAYRFDEPGCHSYNRTKMKNMSMYGPPGCTYVYFTYGCHWMLNAVAQTEGQACAVLIRAAKPLQGHDQLRLNRPSAKNDHDLLSGPGKLCQAMGIHQAHNGLDLFDPNSPLRLEPADPVENIVTGVRIGLAKGKGDELPWRFMDADERPWISARKPLLAK